MVGSFRASMEYRVAVTGTTASVSPLHKSVNHTKKNPDQLSKLKKRKSTINKTKEEHIKDILAPNLSPNSDFLPLPSFHQHCPIP